MRIVTWNCHASSPEKIAKLLATRPDIAVIPECSKREAESMKAAGMSACWVGNLDSKGLGVFAQNGFELSPMVSTPEELRGAAAFRVSGPTEFTLIAV